MLQVNIFIVIITNNKGMNLASFLHSLKEFKDSSLALPIAPVYSLPSQRWYFSSPTLVPLRKRKENSSFFKYLQSFDLLSQQKEATEKSSKEKTLLCLYETKDYFDNKIRHVFDKISMQCRSQVQTRQRVRCQCFNTVQQKKSATFGLGLNSINKAIEASKKNFKSQTPLSKENSVNWNEFTRIIAKQYTTNIWRNDDYLHVYRLPESSLLQTSVFSLVFNDNYIVFGNSNQLPVNQHMKAKALQLCELVRKKLEDFIWKKVQIILQQVEDIKDYELFTQKAKNLLKISTLKIWFYKKTQNNEIYVLGLSDLSFKGVQCVIFKDVSFKLQQTKLFEENQVEQSQNVCNINNIKNVIEGREKLKSIREANALSQIDIKPCLAQGQKYKSQHKNDQEVTQIQCSCCKNLLLANEIVNEITANKIQQVRYLRQMKVGKREFDPYDFVKVCSQCYSVYLKSYRQSTSKQKNQKPQSQKKTFSFYQLSQKEKASEKNNKETSLYILKKVDQINGNSTNASVRRLVRDRSLNLRAKSELNSSKQGEISLKGQQPNQKAVHFNKRLQLPPNLPANRKKYRTANSTNTQTLDLQGVKNRDTSKDELTIQRTFTNNQKTPTSHSFQKQFLPKSRSFKLKGGVPKNINIINKIIMNTTNPTNKTEDNANVDKFQQIQMKRFQQRFNKVVQFDNHLLADEKSQKIKKSRDTVLTNAIDEYENVARPSFKKLIYKNHRNVIKREMNINTEDVWQAGKQENKRKKSIFSYCEQQP